MFDSTNPVSEETFDSVSDINRFSNVIVFFIGKDVLVKASMVAACLVVLSETG